MACFREDGDWGGGGEGVVVYMLTRTGARAENWIGSRFVREERKREKMTYLIEREKDLC